MGKQLEMEDWLSGEVERDAALGQVAEHAEEQTGFMSLSLGIISALPEGRYTGESIRTLVTEAGQRPHHPNAWGALVATAARRKLIIDTGSMTKMRKKSSHARRTPVYFVPNPHLKD